MDTPNLQEEATSSSLSSNRKRKAVDENEDPAEIVPSKRVYFSPPTFRQNWSLPDSIIYYLAKNPKSPESYQKLIRTCRYFFYKSPIIVCSTLTFDVYDPNFSDTAADEDPDRVINISKIEVEQNGSKCVMDLKNTSQKLWITDKIYVKTDLNPETENFMSLLIPRIYQCDAKDVTLDGITITFNDFVFLASKAEDMFYYDLHVINDDGANVAFEKLVEVTKNIKRIDIENDYIDINFSFETFKNLIKIPHFLTLKLFISSTSIAGDLFDIETFYDYMKKNKQTGFIIHFSPISDAFKNRLKAIENEILATEDPDFKVPYFNFDEQDDQKREELFDLFKQTYHRTY